MNQLVIVIDFGAQYSQVIARKIRECNVYCEVLSWKTSFEDIEKKSPIGIVLSGGPSSVYEKNAPNIDKRIFTMGIPVLGICYGMQLMVHLLGGEVIPAQNDLSREYGKALTSFHNHCLLFNTLPSKGVTWMSHGDFVKTIPSSFKVCAKTEHCSTAAIFDEEHNFYGLQFHPEVEHTENGKEIIRKFLDQICHAKGDWSMNDFSSTTIQKIKEYVKDDKVILALSGGVDSSVAAAILSKAIGDQLICIYINHGLMRKNESEQICKSYQKMHLNFHYVDASEEFLTALKGVTDPEQKRHIIGNMFIETFAKKAQEFGGIAYLAQGTIYPDVIESGQINGNLIKSHHNVGGLPERLPFKGIIEPLSVLFKDEVRQLGLELGMDPEMVFRQPFPGPGLAVRIVGEITKEKILMVQEANAILDEVIRKNKYQNKISQYFVALTNMKSVGVMGDMRTYNYAAAIRAVTTSDFMTANYVKLPYRIIDEVSRRIVNEVKGINRVFYDVTSKPPATIEYE